MELKIQNLSEFEIQLFFNFIFKSKFLKLSISSLSFFISLQTRINEAFISSSLAFALFYSIRTNSPITPRSIF